MNEQTRANRDVWDAWTRWHTTSDHHADLARVRSGGLSLRGIEREALPDVRGRRLLHLLCNMGADTLSWARLGADATGVDYSPVTIAAARAAAEETGLPARFVQSDVYDLPRTLPEQFEIVVTTYGVLGWLPDLPRWAESVAALLAPGGTFLLVDQHPLVNALSLDAQDSSASPEDAPMRFVRSGPYAHPSEPVAEQVGTTGEGGPTTLYSWGYGLGDVVGALLGAGLRLVALREHPAIWYPRYPTLVPGDDGLWRWPDPTIDLPLTFSLRATR